MTIEAEVAFVVLKKAGAKRFVKGVYPNYDYKAFKSMSHPHIGGAVWTACDSNEVFWVVDDDKRVAHAFHGDARKIFGDE